MIVEDDARGVVWMSRGAVMMEQLRSCCCLVGFISCLSESSNVAVHDFGIGFVSVGCGGRFVWVIVFATLIIDYVLCNLAHVFRSVVLAHCRYFFVAFLFLDNSVVIFIACVSVRWC